MEAELHCILLLSPIGTKGDADTKVKEGTWVGFWAQRYLYWGGVLLEVPRGQGTHFMVPTFRLQ